ncbi:hypothetical protein [Thermosipho sp. (in: thermotogales)]|jgi:hypothetical protein|uniref:hypothetical protein n=1 Tax=Thermosipho sp. (in: thermotogales) TaxID=1968895 RepID=UPI00257FD837|nr:hypothetical protein [Thermosipho sp. (in: thermotogales)]MBZ4649213.1 hypothetical protein [Thermosipho sp. (in: thermotogales)]
MLTKKFKVKEYTSFNQGDENARTFIVLNKDNKTTGFFIYYSKKEWEENQWKEDEEPYDELLLHYEPLDLYFTIFKGNVTFEQVLKWLKEQFEEIELEF